MNELACCHFLVLHGVLLCICGLVKVLWIQHLMQCLLKSVENIKWLFKKIIMVLGIYKGIHKTLIKGLSANKKNVQITLEIEKNTSNYNIYHRLLKFLHNFDRKTAFYNISFWLFWLLSAVSPHGKISLNFRKQKLFLSFNESY